MATPSPEPAARVPSAGIVASVPGVCFWSWLQGGAAGALFTLGLGVATLWVRGRRTRGALLALWAATAAFWLCGLYPPGPDRLPAVEALDGVPAGRVWLSAATFFAGIGFTAALLDPARALLERFGSWLRPGIGAIVYGAGLTTAGLVALDLHFLDRRATAFSYAAARFHPYLAHHRPGTYYYSHARERVVRDTRGRTFAQVKPPGTVRVVLNGASTMWGHYQDDVHDPARLLRAALRVHDPGRRYEVLMVAAQSKYQLNELVDSVVTLPHWSPDLVISLNGFNEVWYGEKAASYEGMPWIAMQVEGALKVPPLASLFYSGTHLGAARLPSLLSRAPSYVLAEAWRYEAPRYYAYLRQTAQALGRAGIVYAHSFCPNVLEKEPPTAEERQSATHWRALASAVRRRRIVSARIVEDAGQASFDAMDAVNGEEPSFGDLCHLNDAAMRRLTDDLARRVPGWLARRALPHPEPLPEDFPPLGAGRLELGHPSSEEHLRGGWSWPEDTYRWTDGNRAVLQFGAQPGVGATLRVMAGPFLGDGRLSRQRVVVELNGVRLGERELTGPVLLSWNLNPAALSSWNTLAFDLPDAASPADVGSGEDPRHLGLAVEWIELVPPGR